MSQYGWYQFEWDDENKKNGNVQHLRDHGIEPEEAEDCFSHDYQFQQDKRRFDDVYIRWEDQSRQTATPGFPG